MDVNQPPTLEADISFQQIKAYFEGKSFKKGVFATLIPFEKSNMDKGELVPWVFDDYMAKRKANAFIWDITNDAFKADPSYS